MLEDMRYVIALLAIVGITVSVLALRVHYSNEVQPCSINATWDCGIVNHSRYAEIKGVPVAALGIAGYAAIALLALLRFPRLNLAVTFVGFLFALYLTHIEKDILQTYCLYCVISQITILLILLASLFVVLRQRLRRPA
jgi:vitamin-K-epoxide reductase (warfarin-sensitive)